MPKNDRSAYQSEYYRKNQARILEQRTERWQRDPDYREAVSARKEAERLLKAKNAKKQRDGEIKTHTQQIRLSNGDIVLAEMLTYTSAAKLIGVSRTTLQKWDDETVMPPPLYRSAAGKPLLTQDQVIVIARVYRRFFEAGRKWKIEKAFVKALWEELALLRSGIDKV